MVADIQVIRRPVMHFTHVENLPGILAAGCLQADSIVGRSPALRVEAGDLAVKARRKQRRVPLAPFGRVEAILAAHGTAIPVAVRPWWYFESV